MSDQPPGGLRTDSPPCGVDADAGRDTPRGARAEDAGGWESRGSCLVPPKKRAYLRSLQGVGWAGTSNVPQCSQAAWAPRTQEKEEKEEKEEDVHVGEEDLHNSPCATQSRDYKCGASGDVAETQKNDHEAGALPNATATALKSMLSDVAENRVSWDVGNPFPEGQVRHAAFAAMASLSAIDSNPILSPSVTVSDLLSRIQSIGPVFAGQSIWPALFKGKARTPTATLSAALLSDRSLRFRKVSPGCFQAVLRLPVAKDGPSQHHETAIIKAPDTPPTPTKKARIA